MSFNPFPGYLFTELRLWIQDILQGTEGMQSVHDKVGLLLTAGRHRYSSLEMSWLSWRSFDSLLAGEKKKKQPTIKSTFWSCVLEGAKLQKLQFPGQEAYKHHESALSLKICNFQPVLWLLVESSWDSYRVKLLQILAKTCCIQLYFRLKSKK